jgi:hypothetical protein
MSNHAISRNSVKSGGVREVKYVFLSLRRQLRCQAEGKKTASGVNISLFKFGDRIHVTEYKETARKEILNGHAW